MTDQNANPDYYKYAEKTALVRLCGVLGVLTESNDLATAALLAATRIERLEKKIPALNVDLAEASMHAYNGEIARMKLEAELARRDEIIARLKEDAERLEDGLADTKRKAQWELNELRETKDKKIFDLTNAFNDAVSIVKQYHDDRVAKNREAEELAKEVIKLKAEQYDLWKEMR